MPKRNMETGKPSKSVQGNLHEPGNRSISTTLLQRIQLDDPDGWERLVRLFSPVVYQWCRSKGLSQEAASDVSQEVFAAVAKGITTFKRKSKDDSFRGWLWTITINKIRDFVRKSRRHPRAVGGSSFQISMATIEFDTERSEEERNSDSHLVLRGALELMQNEFEPRTIEVFMKSVLENRTAAQIAEELGMNVDAVYKAKSRVLRRLREEVGELLD